MQPDAGRNPLDATADDVLPPDGAWALRIGDDFIPVSFCVDSPASGRCVRVFTMSFPPHHMGNERGMSAGAALYRLAGALSGGTRYAVPVASTSDMQASEWAAQCCARWRIAT